MINADLQDVAHQVHEEFGDQLDPREVDECLGQVAAKFDDAKVRSFVPLLVHRYVRDELLDRLAGLDQRSSPSQVSTQVLGSHSTPDVLKGSATPARRGRFVPPSARVRKARRRNVS